MNTRKQPMNREDRIRQTGYDYDARDKVWIDQCNLCGADDWIVIAHHDRYGFNAQTMACSRCGLSMLNPRMTSAAYADFYAKWYRPLVSAFYDRPIDAVTIQHEQREYAVEMERFTRPYLAGRRGQSLLDVGGSTGVVAVHFCRSFGLQPTVIDPAPDEIEEAEKFGLKTVTALVEEWDPGNLRYEIIGMFQTIDHLLDIKTTLQKIRQLITPNGLLVVDIVDFRAAYLKNRSVALATKIDHPYSLTEFVTQSYLARAGFRILRRAYSADNHLVAYICSPVAPRPEHLPARDDVRDFFMEMRYIQNTGNLPGGPA